MNIKNEEAIATAHKNLDEITKVINEMLKNGISDSDNPAFNNFMKSFDDLAKLVVKLTDENN